MGGICRLLYISGADPIHLNAVTLLDRLLTSEQEHISMPFALFGL